tara:strand:- start:637 stop:1056 length:420 start_codon:yes stop_codon:yes gene_type:complete
MSWIDKAIESIAQHEGFSSTVYKCTAGYDTIGYGKRVKYLQVTKEQSKEWLKEDVENIKYILANKYEWYTSAPDQVKAVVLEMVYQLGLHSFSKFKKTIKLLENKDYRGASTEMLDSKWARTDTPRRATILSDRLTKIG